MDKLSAKEYIPKGEGNPKKQRHRRNRVDMILAERLNARVTLNFVNFVNWGQKVSFKT